MKHLGNRRFDYEEDFEKSARVFPRAIERSFVEDVGYENEYHEIPSLPLHAPVKGLVLFCSVLIANE